MSHVRVKAKVITDHTGASVTVPIILVEQAGRVEPLQPLVDYFLATYYSTSSAWRDKVCQAVGMLLDYMAVNGANFGNAPELFTAFAHKMFSGTVGEDGLDPSGLYWLGKRLDNGKTLLNQLAQFSDWMHKEYGTAQLNPWREATTYEARLNWAAFVHKTQNTFLGHLDDFTTAAAAAKQARLVRQRRTPTGDRGETKAFPDERFMQLLFEGFTVPGKEHSSDPVERYQWRDICITILMHWGGLRVSEAFHLWVGDVLPHPDKPDEAIVRLYHPIDGAAPTDTRAPNGKVFPNRETYLKANYPGYLPRHMETGNRFAGWKGMRMSDVRQNYRFVHWLPTGEAGRLFMQAWKLYNYQLMRARIGADKHPFQFVSFHGQQRGEPYTIDAYRAAHERAVRRIGLEPAKFNGTTHHGHRHAYGQRARRAGVDPLVTQRGLGHRSIESQEVYTAPSIGEVTRALEKASSALESGRQLPVAIDLEAAIYAKRKDVKQLLTNKGRKT